MLFLLLLFFFPPVLDESGPAPDPAVCVADDLFCLLATLMLEFKNTLAHSRPTIEEDVGEE